MAAYFCLTREKAGSKDFKDRLKEHRKLWEKDLAGAWKEKAFYQRCQPFVAPKDAEEMRQRCHGNDYMQAAIERHVKDLERHLKDSGEAPRGANDEPKGLPATAATIKVDVDANGMPGPSAPTSPAQDATLQEKRRADADDDQRISEPVKLVAARSRNHAIHQKALAQLREPDRQKEFAYPAATTEGIPGKAGRGTQEFAGDSGKSSGVKDRIPRSSYEEILGRLTSNPVMDNSISGTAPFLNRSGQSWRQQMSLRLCTCCWTR